MNKKGLELSINFIVILIFCVIVLVFGLSLAKNMFSEANEFKGEVDKNTKREIESLLSSGQRVAIPLNTAKMNNGDTKAFGLGILNTLENKDKFIFYSEMSDGSENLQILPKFVRIIDLKNNQKHSESITVRVNGVDPGTYIVNAVLCYPKDSTQTTPGTCPAPKTKKVKDEFTGKGNDPKFKFSSYNQYGSTKKIYITVP